MAQDWMKVELHTPEKPRLLALAARLGADRDLVLGKCVRFWAWADRNTTTGRLPPGFTYEALDVMLGCPGFSEAAASQEWLGRDERGVFIPNFTKHNGKSAKKRALTARRVAEFRKRTGNAPGNAGGNAHVTQAALARPRARPDQRERQESSGSGAGAQAPGAGLAGCLARCGVGEPALSLLASSPALTAEIVTAEHAAVQTDGRGIRDRGAVLVSRLCKRAGVKLPKSRASIAPELHRLNGELHKLRDRRRFVPEGQEG